MHKASPYSTQQFDKTRNNVIMGMLSEETTVIINDLDMHKATPYSTRKAIRLQGFDYSTHANYFITVVVKDRLNLFGEIKDGIMLLNQAGEMIIQQIENLKFLYDDTDVPHFVVMPNHIHCIIAQMGHDYIPDIMRRFKSETTHHYIEGVKTKGWRQFNGKLWQGRFYDHIIRNQRAYDYIANYIFENPARWNKDKINIHCDTDYDTIMKTVISYDSDGHL